MTDRDVQNSATTAPAQPGLPPPRKTIISSYRLLVTVIIGISIIAGLTLPFLPELTQLVLIAIIPAVVVCVIILRNPRIGIYMFYFYIWLRPYEIIPALYPLRLTMVIEIVTLLAWVISLSITKTKVKWNWFDWLFLGFLGVIGVTVGTAANNYMAYETWQMMAVRLVIFVIATNVVTRTGHLKTLIWIMLIIHSYFAAKAISNFVTGSYFAAGLYTSGKVSGGFIGDENDFSMAINTMIPFAFFGLFYYRGRAKLISAAMLLLFILAVASSFSRGGMVGLAAVVIYCILSMKRKIAGLAVAGALALALFLFAPSSYWREASTITEVDQGTAETRIKYWHAALRMFLDYPLVGVGAANGGVHMPQYVQGFRDPNTQWGRAFHGTFPQVIAELGLAGSAIYFAMMFLVFRWLFRVRRRKVPEPVDDEQQYIANSLIGALIGYFACATFLSTAYYPQLWYLYTFAMILYFIIERGGTGHDRAAVDSGDVAAAGAGCVSQ
jgi:probable O-glycosylation ligase (exosortase A-associated)